jgi:predicted PurR-regulated permease PerM
VALIQGALAWVLYWILGVGAPVLLGVLVALLSLLPAVGAAIVWVPVAIYLFATGEVWQAVVVVVFSALVIGSVDNVLRPILVGKDTKLPDYVVLISTLGGLAVFGANGFVIGPVIAALFVAVWEIFVASRKTVIADNQPVIAGNQPVIPSEARDPAGLQAMPEQDPSLRSG